MFVLPPPPRYPAQMMYGSMYPGGQLVPMIETNNILSHPAGPDYQFLVGEGLYVLEDDLLLATPPPHPSEAPVINVNPLATTPLPATAGPRISLVSIVDPPRPRALSLLLAAAAAEAEAEAAAAAAAATTSDSLVPPVEEHLSESESAGLGAGASASQHADSATGRLSFHTTSASGTSDSSPLSGAIPIASPTTAAAAHHDASLFSSSLATSSPLSSSLPASFGLGGFSRPPGTKQRKPKNNVTKSNSSFISRVIVHDGLTKRLQERPLDGLFGFANINRAFQWLDLAAEKKADYLTKILFTKAHCLCHDINPVTKNATHVDIIMGFSTGEIIWWEPISQRYVRLNKNGIIRGTPISEIRWVPGSENFFMAAFMDGSLVIFDKEKDDAAFTVDEEELGRQRMHRHHHDTRTHVQIDRSIHSRGHKANPVAFWKLSNQRINAFAFASGQSLLAVVSEDGSLRIIDYLKEELIGLFYSYYGGLTCVCWSPDDKYVVTGGQDDLLSIWSVTDATLAARCQGHHSWVTSVSFDPWRCDDRNYRFGSVGEDCRLCLWDFSMGMLIRPKAVATAAAAATTAATAPTTAAAAAAAPGKPDRQPRPFFWSDSTISSSGHVEFDEPIDHIDHAVDETGSETGTNADERIHPVEPRARTALLPPVCSHVVAKEPLCWLGFTEKSIMTSSKTGHVRTWKRPIDNTAQAEDGQS